MRILLHLLDARLTRDLWPFLLGKILQGFKD